MKIFLVGGGTGGPTAPLLAIAEALRKFAPRAEFFFVGSKRSIEEKFLAASGLPINHLTIPAGKWRRYFSFRNLTDLVKFFFGFLKSLWLIKKYRPDVIVGAGSYVQVPLAYAGYFLRVPIVIHQQDLQLLLSTRLVVPIAQAITVSFSYSGKQIPGYSGLLAKIPKSKIFVTGNPVRTQILEGSVKEARILFHLNENYPTLLVLGGATGSENLNRVIFEALPELLKYVQIVHVTGGRVRNSEKINWENYHQFEFLGEELRHAYAVADLVISRGGMSTITELARLGKVTVFVPLPKSPQEYNVRFLAAFGLAIGVSEKSLTAELLIGLVRKLLWDHEAQKVLRQNFQKLMPRDSASQIAKVILRVVQKAKKDEK